MSRERPARCRTTSLPCPAGNVIREDDEVDEHQLRSWIEQASKLPGEKM